MPLGAVHLITSDEQAIDVGIVAEGLQSEFWRTISTVVNLVRSDLLSLLTIEPRVRGMRPHEA